MSSIDFRTQVLAVIASALVVATALLGWLAYATVYQQILSGFDRKLLGISGTVAGLTDGDGHAEYQRPHRLTRFVGADPGWAWGWDAERAALVRIDLARAAVVAYREWPEEPRALLWLSEGERLLVQQSDGSLVDAADPERVIDSTPRAEVWLSDGQRLYLREAAGLRPVPDPDEQAVEAVLMPLPSGISLLSFDPDSGQWLAWDSEAGALLRIEATGRIAERLNVDLGDHQPVGLVAGPEGALFAAEELLTVTWSSGGVSDDFEPGWYDESHPYFERHAPIYRSLRERVGLTFLYTEVYIGGDQIRYILDGTVGDDHSPPGYLDSVPDADIDAVVRAQVEGTPFVSGIRQWEAWGLVKVSAAPILNSSGRIVALAGADVDIGVIRSKTRNALFAVLGVGALLLSISALVSVWVAQSITRPLREIKYAAMRIAAGQYGARVPSTATDEIGRLAGSLDRLSLRLREQADSSSASQSVLLSGRLDGALGATLGNTQDHPRAWWVAHAGGRMLLIDDGGLVDEVDRAERRGMLRALIRRLVATATLTPDAVLAADPALQLVLDWVPRERRASWAGRGRALLASRASGERQRLSPGSLTIAVDTQLLLDDGLLLVDRGDAR